MEPNVELDLNVELNAECLDIRMLSSDSILTRMLSDVDCRARH